MADLNRILKATVSVYTWQKIVDAAGGNIVVKSEVGKGSKLTIYFKAE